MTDENARKDFLESHFMLVRGVASDARECGVSDSIVVLADLSDASGAVFADGFGRFGGDVSIDGDAWSAHFPRQRLANFLSSSWPAAKKVISALRSEGGGVHYVVLVIASGGVQLRGTRELAV